MGMGEAMVGSSLIGMFGSSQAAGAQADAAQAQADVQRYIFDQNTELTQPWRDAGTTALDALMYEYGLGPMPGSQTQPAAQPQQQQAPQGLTQADIDFNQRGDYMPAGDFRRSIRGVAGLDRSYPQGEYNWLGLDGSNIPGGARPSVVQPNTGGQPGGQPGTQSAVRVNGGPTGGGGTLSAMASQAGSPSGNISVGNGAGPIAERGGGETYGGYMATPGYNYRFNEGVRAIDSSAASRGNLFSGATGQALTEFGQNIGAADYQNYLAGLSGIAGYGQNANSQQLTAGTNYATGTSNALANLGNAQAAGWMGATNAVQNGIGNWMGWQAYQGAV
jgi:hypothetical protein